MNVWVYSRLDITNNRFNFEIWTKEPTSQQEVYFQWPFEAQEMDVRYLIEKIFERANKYQGFDLHFVGHN